MRAERLYYRAMDGWEAPLWRVRCRPGATGEPVILAHTLGAGRESFDLNEEGSVVRALHEQGHEVFILSHRGDRGAVAPAQARGFDFDDIASHDVPAAIARVQAATGTRRVLWIGHGLGGLLLYAHLARGGAPDIAGAITISAPVRFEVPRSHARLAAAVSRILPAGVRLPTRRAAQALAAFSEPPPGQLSGPRLRGLMLWGAEDMDSGLARQIARWIGTGGFCDRDDRLDYVEALRGVRAHLLVVGADEDRLCPPEHARAVLDVLDPATTRYHRLSGHWGHLGAITGADARVLTPLLGWLQQNRARCWS